VLEREFGYNGQRYPTLSKIARVITQTNWNGYLFFKEALAAAQQAADAVTE